MNDRLWVDANVVIRFLTNDPTAMADSSELLFQRADRGEVDLKVAGLIVAEVVWVLGSFYRWSRPEISDGLSAFLIRDGLSVEDLPLALDALRVMSASNVSYIDAYLAESARRAHEPVASFDHAFARLNVKWIEPG